MKGKTLKIDLSRIRKEKKITQSELARKAGLSQSTISDIENYSKSPTLDTINKIAVALDIHPYELLKCEEK